MYEALEFDDFEQAKAKFENYLSKQKLYKKNKFEDLSTELQERIADQWSNSFERWGYKK